ncbi:uncharacterized protein LOC115664402 [Syzygium oleosum]|uniref:uncharacterized protein LOC115664402 n=1 Tax=Syzygium oleosum TaxID=219896 RepID=UPI0024B8BAEA|nr:uncharacterized protein LOC115664402 [Syzygium oleosum]
MEASHGTSEEFTGLSWEVAASSESDDDGVAIVNFPSDDDDEELAQLMQKQSEFGKKSIAALGGLREAEPRHSTDGAPAEGNDTYYEESGSDEQNDSSKNQHEDDDPVVHRRKRKYPFYDPSSSSSVLTVGKKFFDAKQFKEGIIKYSIAEHRSLQFTHNTKDYVRAKCSQPSCSWKIYGARSKRDGLFQIRSLQEEHTCFIMFDNKRVTSAWLSKHFFNTIKVMPDVKCPQLKQLVREHAGINVSLNQCKRAKQKVMKKLLGRYKEEYGQIWEYAGECRLQNPASRVYVEVVEWPLPNHGTNFDRIYICFDACKQGFVAGCR